MDELAEINPAEQKGSAEQSVPPTISRLQLEMSENALPNKLGWNKLVNQGKVTGLDLGDIDGAKQVALLYPEMAGSLEEVEDLIHQLREAKETQSGWIYDNARNTYGKFCEEASADDTFGALTSLTLDQMIQSGELAERFPQLNDPEFVKEYYRKGTTLSDLNTPEAFKHRPGTLLNIFGHRLTDEEKQKLQRGLADHIADLNPLHVGLILNSQHDSFYAVEDSDQTYVVRHRRDPLNVEQQEVDIRTLNGEDQIREVRVDLRPDVSQRARDSYVLHRTNNAVLSDGGDVKRVELPDSEVPHISFLSSNSES